MTLSLTRYSKKLSEVHIFPADFTNQLRAGEFITAGSWVYTVTMITGTDPTPQGILLNTPTINGNTVTQQLQQGVVGAIYRIVLVVQTNQSRSLSLETKLAVLPDDYPATGSYVSYYETSQPYPLYLPPSDFLYSLASCNSGILQTLLVDTNISDTLHFSAATQTSYIYSTLRTQAEQDTLHIPTVATQNGTLTTLLITSNQQDTVHFNTATLNSTLTTILITTNQSDTLHFTTSALNGTLT